MFSFLKGLFGSKGESGAPGPGAREEGPAIGFVLLKGDQYDFNKALGILSKAKIAGKAMTKVELKDGMLVGYVGDAMVALALMPAPVPAGDLEGPCATSWMWPKGRSANEVKAHKSHLLVTCMLGKATGIQRRLIISQVIGLLAKDPNVMGIYWAEAGMIHYPEVFMGMAEPGDVDLLATNMWIDFRVGKNPDGTSTMFTQGLAALGLMEIEYPKCKMPPAELREWGQNIAKYLLDNGLVLLDGQTLGATADEQVKIRHTKSQFGAKGKVIRLGD